MDFGDAEGGIFIEAKPRNGSTRVVISETRPEPDPKDVRPDPTRLNPIKTRPNSPNYLKVNYVNLHGSKIQY